MEKFAAVKDLQKIRLLLRKAAGQQALCVWWIRDRTISLNSKVLDYSPVTQFMNVTIPIAADPQLLLTELRGQRECLAMIYVKNEAVICFKAYFFAHDENSLRLKVPDIIYKVQRRKDFRMPISQGYEVNLDFSIAGGNYRCRVLDLSSEGLAFAVSEEEAPVFPKDIVVEKARFTLRQRQIEAAIRICHRSRMTGETYLKGYRIGVFFETLDERDRDYIASIIAEQIILNFKPEEGSVRSVSKK